jgi:hypothetical protein
VADKNRPNKKLGRPHPQIIGRHFSSTFAIQPNTP